MAAIVAFGHTSRSGLADNLDMSLADRVEGILLHALEGGNAIDNPVTLAAIGQLRSLYDLQLSAKDSHAHPHLDR